MGPVGLTLGEHFALRHLHERGRPLIEDRIIDDDDPGEPTPRLLKLAEAADVASERTGREIGTHIIRKLIKHGDLPGRYIMRHLYVPTFALERYLATLLADDVDTCERQDEPLAPPIAPPKKAK